MLWEQGTVVNQTGPCFWTIQREQQLRELLRQVSPIQPLAQ